LRLGTLVDRWGTARDPAPKTLHGARRAVAQLVSLVGDIPVNELSGEHLFDYRDALAILPRRLSDVERRMDFVALLDELIAQDSDRERIRRTTVVKQLRHIQTLVSFAHGERWISRNDLRHIPVDGPKPLVRRPFTAGEVRKLFTHPLFVAPWEHLPPPRKISDETLRWLMILGLFTGARLEELGQLLVADVRSDNGIAYLAITDSGSDAVEPASKSLKTAASNRNVPIHPKLLELGFVEFVERRGRDRHDRLFPDLTRDRFERYTRLASRECNRLIDTVSRDPALVFHSFRHLFKDLCRATGLIESVSDQLTGHAPPSVGGRYGAGVDLPTLAAQIARIGFDFVDWAPILLAARSGPTAAPGSMAGE